MLESFNTHLLTNTPKRVIRTRKRANNKWPKEKEINNAMAKRKRNEKTIVDIILHKTLKMAQNEPTLIWG